MTPKKSSSRRPRRYLLSLSQPRAVLRVNSLFRIDWLFLTVFRWSCLSASDLCAGTRLRVWRFGFQRKIAFGF